MSLFESLNVATRGLAVAQLGISTTGQNMVNASTEGYSRKRIEQSAEWRKDGSYGQMGFGVEVYGINRIRDQFIDRLLNQEHTRFGYYTVKDAAYTRIEDIFQEPSEWGLNSILNEFWDSWAVVANNPNSAGARETLRSNAETMVDQFHYITTQLRSYKDTINDEVESRVKRINELTSGIYNCNKVIAATEGSSLNHKANDTRDQRDLLLEELAKLIDVDYFEDDYGSLIVSTNGNMLVSPARNHEIVMRRMEMTGEDGYQYSRVEMCFDLTGKEYKPKNGELKALLDIRDEEIPKYEEYVNGLAKGLITEVNKIHQQGYALSGLTFIDFFDSDPNKFSAANINVSAAVKKDVNNIAAGIGGVINNVDKLSYTPTLLFSPEVDGDGNPIPVVPPRSIPLDLTSLNDSYRYIQKNSIKIEVVDTTFAPPLNRELQEGKDYVVDYNNATITFMDNPTNEMLYNPNADPPNTPMEVLMSFKYAGNGYSGPGDGDNALAISQLRNSSVMQSDLFGKKTQTINEFYSGMLGRLGTERNDAANGLETRKVAMEQLRTRQKEVSGVNLDEEMAMLIQYEYSYQASARFLSTVNTMIDTLLNM